MEDYNDNQDVIRDLVKEIIELSKQLGQMTEKYANLQMFQREQELLRQGKSTAAEIGKQL